SRTATTWIRPSTRTSGSALRPDPILDRPCTSGTFVASLPDTTPDQGEPSMNRRARTLVLAGSVVSMLAVSVGLPGAQASTQAPAQMAVPNSTYAVWGDGQRTTVTAGGDSSAYANSALDPSQNSLVTITADSGGIYGIAQLIAEPAVTPVVRYLRLNVP